MGTQPEKPTEDDIRELVSLFSKIQLKLKLYQRIFESRIEISDIQVGLLQIIADRENVSPSDLKEEFQLHKATISGHLDKLLKAGFIESTANPSDHRKKFLKPTRRGLDVLEKFEAIKVRVARNIFRMFPVKSVRLVKTVLENVDARGEKFRERIEEFFETQEREHGHRHLLDIPTGDLLAQLQKTFPVLFAEP
ncbi:MAG: MarR family winged helix-turn-helix transcriptional regulator [Promethearchaeota archaeon]